jgi:hypothetical protein
MPFFILPALPLDQSSMPDSASTVAQAVPLLVGIMTLSVFLNQSPGAITPPFSRHTVRPDCCFRSPSRKQIPCSESVKENWRTGRDCLRYAPAKPRWLAVLA